MKLTLNFSAALLAFAISIVATTIVYASYKPVRSDMVSDDYIFQTDEKK